MDDTDLDAGEFTVWLAAMLAALRGGAASDVPCGSCSACCTSFQFVHIEPDETNTLARIPRSLLFAAPGLPGVTVLGHDERGHCPMFVNNVCSIYEDRPRACRTYDCRVFAAAGIEADADKPLIVERARRWRFRYEDADSRPQHEAIVIAAQADASTLNATGRAVRAISSVRQDT
jgi:uncharacterized protein